MHSCVAQVNKNSCILHCCKRGTGRNT